MTLPLLEWNNFQDKTTMRAVAAIYVQHWGEEEFQFLLSLVEVYRQSVICEHLHHKLSTFCNKNLIHNKNCKLAQ